MKTYAYVSRHTLTEDQLELANKVNMTTITSTEPLLENDLTSAQMRYTSGTSVKDGDGCCQSDSRRYPV